MIPDGGVPVRPPVLKVTTVDRLGLGISLILGAMLLLSLGDAMVKQISTEMSLWQVFFARGLIAVPVLLFLPLLLGHETAKIH